MEAALTISRRLDASTARFALSSADPIVGMKMAARMPMIAMTVSSSMSVKAVGRRVGRRIVEGGMAEKTRYRGDSFPDKYRAQADFPRPGLDKSFPAPLGWPDEDLSRWKVRRRSRCESVCV